MSVAAHTIGDHSDSRETTSLDRRRIRRRRSVIPGFGITLGLTLTWLALIVLIPLGGLFLKTAELSPSQFWSIVTGTRALNALKISFGLSLVAAAVNLFFGALVGWALVRYEFPGKRIVDAIIDIPFALPTAVAGIALTTLFAENGWLGGLLAPLGIKVAFTPLGILIAVIFIGLPFVVRTLQPVLEDLDAKSRKPRRRWAPAAGRRSPKSSRRSSCRVCGPGLRSPSRAPSVNMARSSSLPAICRISPRSRRS